MRKIFYSTLFIFSIALWGCVEENEIAFNSENRTVKVKADLAKQDNPSDEKQTRVSLQPDGNNVKVSWKPGDVIYLVFAEDGEAIGKTTVTLMAVNISSDGSKANYEFEVPKGVGDTFDLYSIHGGDSFDDYALKVAAVNESTTADLNGLGQNVVMCQSVVKDIDLSLNNAINLTFDHIGSLFHIKLSSLEGATLSGITRAILWSPDKIFAVQNDDDDVTYNPIMEELSDTNYNSELTFNIAETDLSPNGTIDFWGWYIPGSTDGWPALGLKLTSKDGDITSSNAKPARNAAIDKGKAYHFYATYSGEQLLLTNVGGDMRIKP